MYATYYFWPPGFISRTSHQNVGWTVISSVQCIYTTCLSGSIWHQRQTYRRLNGCWSSFDTCSRPTTYMVGTFYHLRQMQHCHKVVSHRYTTCLSGSFWRQRQAHPRLNGCWSSLTSAADGTIYHLRQMQHGWMEVCSRSSTAWFPTFSIKN